MLYTPFYTTGLRSGVIRIARFCIDSNPMTTVVIPFRWHSCCIKVRQARRCVRMKYSAYSSCTGN